MELYLKAIAGLFLLSSTHIDYSCASPTPHPATRDEATITNYMANVTMVSMEYHGPIAPNGLDIVLIGTAQEVHAQIMELNPFFDRAQFPGYHGNTHVIGRRNTITPPDCNLPYEKAISTAIMDGVDYLMSLPGRCYVGAGPRACARISCLAGSSIYLCNDNDYAINPSCDYLGGSYAMNIVNTCSSGSNVVGQEFDTENYNVLVTSSSSC